MWQHFIWFHSQFWVTPTASWCLLVAALQWSFKQTCWLVLRGGFLSDSSVMEAAGFYKVQFSAAAWTTDENDEWVISLDSSVIWCPDCLKNDSLQTQRCFQVVISEELRQMHQHHRWTSPALCMGEVLHLRSFFQHNTKIHNLPLSPPGGRWTVSSFILR